VQSSDPNAIQHLHKIYKIKFKKKTDIFFTLKR